MGKLILITGGARSGKSSLAEKMAKESGSDVTYVATAIPLDKEMELRIDKHKARRPSNWGLIERYRDISLSDLKEGSTIIIDCLTIMTTNLIFDEIEDINDLEDLSVQEVVENRVFEELNKLVEEVKKFSGTVILVTNEIGMGLVPDSFFNRFFRDLLGKVNIFFANEANLVYMCISGIPLKVKEEL